MDINVFQQTLFGFHPFCQSGKVWQGLYQWRWRVCLTPAPWRPPAAAPASSGSWCPAAAPSAWAALPVRQGGSPSCPPGRKWSRSRRTPTRTRRLAAGTARSSQWGWSASLTRTGGHSGRTAGLEGNQRERASGSLRNMSVGRSVSDIRMDGSVSDMHIDRSVSDMHIDESVSDMHIDGQSVTCT